MLNACIYAGNFSYQKEAIQVLYTVFDLISGLFAYVIFGKKTP